jgi:hypothetical protein
MTNLPRLGEQGHRRGSSHWGSRPCRCRPIPPRGSLHAGRLARGSRAKPPSNVVWGGRSQKLQPSCRSGSPTSRRMFLGNMTGCFA